MLEWKNNKTFQSFPFFFSNAESSSAKKFSLTLEKSPILTFLNVSRLWENLLKSKGFQYIFFFKLFPEQACQLQCSPGRLNYRFLEMLNCCISITVDVIDSIDTILFHSHQFHNQLNSVWSMLCFGLVIWVFFPIIAQGSGKYINFRLKVLCFSCFSLENSLISQSLKKSIIRFDTL